MPRCPPSRRIGYENRVWTQEAPGQGGGILRTKTPETRHRGGLGQGKLGPAPLGQGAQGQGVVPLKERPWAQKADGIEHHQETVLVAALCEDSLQHHCPPQYLNHAPNVAATRGLLSPERGR